MEFAIGQRVVVRGTGLGEVTGHAARDATGRPRPTASGEAPAFYIVETATRMVFAPVDSAGAVIRSLIDAAAAAQHLAILREADGAPGDGLESMVTPRAQAVLGDGTPLDAARFLRELYALPALTHRQGMAVLTYEDVVLDEIAVVLGLDRAALIDEMRDRYPAFAARVAQNQAGTSPDGPVVVATPITEPPVKPKRRPRRAPTA